MQVCTSLQTDNHASTPPLSFFTSQMPFLQPNQQRQTTVRQTEKKWNYKFVASLAITLIPTDCLTEQLLFQLVCLEAF